jgi:Cd2+/Zn2+-exporting ATPase
MIRQNVIFSMAVVVGLIPLTLFGLVPLSVAVICHEGSTVLVALHGLRLLSRRDRFARTSIELKGDLAEGQFSRRSSRANARG